MLHTLTLKNEGADGVMAEILLDGKPVEGVTAVHVESRVGEVNRVHIELLSYLDISVDVDADDVEIVDRKRLL